MGKNSNSHGMNLVYEVQIYGSSRRDSIEEINGS
jgi:hypothetical protein